MAPRTKPKPQLGTHFLRQWREKREIRQQVAADAVNISRELLSKIENQKSPYLQQYLEGLAVLYQESPATLLSHNPFERAPPVTDEAEIRRFVERIAGLGDKDVEVVMSVILNARGFRQAGSTPADSYDQSLSANRHREEEPSR